MSSPRTTGPATTVAKIAVGAGELRVQIYTAAHAVDLRWFEPGGGPAAVQMPTKTGVTFPLSDLGEVIAALKKAELIGRAHMLRGVE